VVFPKFEILVQLLQQDQGKENGLIPLLISNKMLIDKSLDNLKMIGISRTDPGKFDLLGSLYIVLIYY
jgi:hypothetical protein